MRRTDLIQRLALFDAFSMSWKSLKFYAFPPFSVIGAMLAKIEREAGMGVVVLPNWPTQSWYPKAVQLMAAEPVYVKASKDLLRLPSHPQKIHPIWDKINLIICLLSGKA